MKRDRAVEIIRKCLALSENNNSFEEAKTAALKAQQLMVEHGLTQDDLNASLNRIVHSVITDWARIPLWKKALASIVAPNYRCFWYVKTMHGESIIIFCGLDGDVELAKTVYRLLENIILDETRQFEQARRKIALDNPKQDGLMYSRATKHDFIFGYLEGIRESFYNQVQENKYWVITTLPVSIQKELERTSLSMKKEKGVSSASDEEAKNSGKEGGRNALKHI